MAQRRSQDHANLRAETTTVARSQPDPESSENEVVVQKHSATDDQNEGSRHTSDTPDRFGTAIHAAKPIATNSLVIPPREDLEIQPTTIAPADKPQPALFFENLFSPPDPLVLAHKEIEDRLQIEAQLHRRVCPQREQIESHCHAEIRFEAQLQTAQEEIERLRQERSAHISIIPVSTRTEDDCLKLISSINQNVIDLAQLLLRGEYTIAHTLNPGSRKQQRMLIQSFLCEALYAVVFRPFSPRLHPDASQELQEVSDKLAENREY